MSEHAPDRPSTPRSADRPRRRRSQTGTRHPAVPATPVITATTASPGAAGAGEPVGFAALGVPAPLVEVLSAQGIGTAFPIQAATLPDSLAGRDVLGRGRTGSGKTIAFALPLVAALSSSGRRRTPGAPRALVLVPTRELANQVAETITPLARKLGLHLTTVFGGVSQSRQVSALTAGVDIVVACPGRLEDLMRQGKCRLDAAEVTVLDEADHMADLGFLPGVTRILAKTPRDAQRLLFSATLDGGVDVLVRRFLHDPVTHSVDSVESPVTTMEHHVLSVTDADKAAVVRRLVAGHGRTVAFTRTKHQARKLAKSLTQAGIPSRDLHGNLSQGQREKNLGAFSDGKVRVLVATDIAARGIHVDDITLVVHVDPPAEHKAYLHRSGRTARAGAEGVVVTVATPQQSGDVRQLMRRAGIVPSVHQVTPGHRVVAELAGPEAPYVAAPVEQPTPASRPRSRGPRRGGAPASRRSGTAPARSGTPRSSSARSGSSRRSGSSTQSVADFSRQGGNRRGR